jgi:ABC-2 type transport system ATP-binding protein
MLTGVLDPTSGTASIQDHDISREPLAAREHLGIVPEEANVYVDLSVWRNVMLMAELHGMPRAERKKEGPRQRPVNRAEYPAAGYARPQF